MDQINMGKFGTFVSELRRERGLTQRELGDRLFVSDKTVSKWERGLSLPSVTLLLPLADVLGVTVTELLRGERIREEATLSIREVEQLVACSFTLSAEEKNARRASRKKWCMLYVVCLLVSVTEIALLLRLTDLTFAAIGSNVFLVDLLMLLFGGWFCFFAKDALPTYYDEHRISTFSDGVFRMNVPGLYFNNSNWPHIVRACRVWMLAAAVVFPLLYGALYALGLAGTLAVELGVTLAACLGFFLPVYVVGRKYQ